MSHDRFRALTLYWSAGGNTAKVARALNETLGGLGLSADLMEITAELDVGLDPYRLVLVGVPVYAFLPPEPAIKFLKKMQSDRFEVLPSAPERPGRYAAVFCTYGGPHTGIREAIPCLKFMGQVLEHGGFRVVDEWTVVGQFHHPSRQHLNTGGRLGDIRGRPDEHDLKEVQGKLRGLLRRLQHLLPLQGAEL